MSDVRSLLKNERAARRVNHPQAQYSSTGVLTCKACRIQLKSDALWPTHLSSPQHINTLKKLASGLKSQDAPNKGTKRKADNEEDTEETLAVRKRVRAEDVPTGAVAERREEPKQAPSPPDETHSVDKSKETDRTPPAKRQRTDDVVDEDEWAAFERDVATPPPEETTSRPSAISAAATISAAPMTVTEIAAKSRQEASTQAKERREAEIEGEKEDAQRRLEEEFDQMEELEERVKRLKEKREELRIQMQNRKRANSREVEDEDEEKEKEKLAINEVESDEEGESDFEDDWDNWGRR